MRQRTILLVLALVWVLSACSLDLDIESLAKNLGENTSPSTDTDDGSGGGGGGAPGFVPVVGQDIQITGLPAVAGAYNSFSIIYGGNVNFSTITASGSDIEVSTTGTVASCLAEIPWGVGAYTYARITGCTGVGTISISIKANTAKNLAGAFIGGTAVTTIPLDAVAPTAPSAVILGVPTSLSSSPTITYTPGTDANSGIAKHRVRIALTQSPWSTIQDWTDHVSGDAVDGITLVSGKEYSVEVQALDNAGNLSATSSTVTFFGYTPTVDCSVGTPAIGSLCTEGTIYAGTFDGGNYMTTPGGCTNSTTPTCAGGADTLQKYWNDGTATYSAVPGTEKISIAGSATPSSSSFRGDVNAAAIVAHHGSAANAAKYCLDMTYGGHNDWYLPSKSELSYLYCKAVNVLGMHQTSRPDEDPNCVATGKQALLTGFVGANYWSSTEVSQLPGTYAWSQTFALGSQMSAVQSSPLYVRCVHRY